MITNTIGDFFQVKGGKRLPKGSTFSGVKTEHPYLRVTDFERNGLKSTNIKYINSEVQAAIKNYIIDSGDVYISIAGTIGVAGIIPEQFHKANLTENAAKFLPKQPETVHNRYFCYILNSESVQNIIKSKTMAVGVPKLALFRILEIPLNLPSLAEQKKIAEILDAADSLRQKDQQLIEHYDRLGLSLFFEMFGDPVTNSQKWCEESLDKLCIKITDGTHHSPGLCETGFPYVTAKHVKDSGLRFFDKPTYIEKSAHDEIYKRCSPEYGDVLYIKDGATTGIACINTFKEPISLLSSLALLKLDTERVNNYFLCYWLNHRGIKNKLIHQYMSGAAIQRYTLKKIKSFKSIVPPIELQIKFSERMADIEKQKSLAQQSLKKSNDLFNSLLQKAFKGELTTN